MTRDNRGWYGERGRHREAALKGRRGRRARPVRDVRGMKRDTDKVIKAGVASFNTIAGINDRIAMQLKIDSGEQIDNNPEIQERWLKAWREAITQHGITDVSESTMKKLEDYNRHTLILTLAIIGVAKGPWAIQSYERTIPGEVGRWVKLPTGWYVYKRSKPSI